MKKILPLLALILLSSCISRQKSSSLEPGEPLTIYLGEQETMELRISPNSPFLLPENSPYKLLMGLLAGPSHLILRDGKVMMTKISMKMAVSPESGFLDVEEGDFGKWALVQGRWQGDLYEAEILYVLPEGYSPLEDSKLDVLPFSISERQETP